MTKSPPRKKLAMGSTRMLALLGCVLLSSAGCRQKMAEAPYYRPYDESDFFPDHSSARPLERGVIHRGQYLESDPLVTGLTREEWSRFYALENKATDMTNIITITAPKEDREKAIGAPRYDQRAKDKKEPVVYVEEFPFPIKEEDLKRGQERFTIYCAVCHGPLGNGRGKIWERGYLNPTSFHTTEVSEIEQKVKISEPPDVPLGHSRGYAIWGIRIPLRDVPEGYIFEVITKGFGGMPNYAAQIAPADRWRIIAYVRVLQFSQHAPANAVKAGGKTP